METFYGEEAHEDYVQWLARHWEDGFVLHSNSPPHGALKLHKSRCHTIGGGGSPPTYGDTWTNYPKRCSEDQAALVEWALAHGANIRELPCGTCRP